MCFVGVAPPLTNQSSLDRYDLYSLVMSFRTSFYKSSCFVFIFRCNFVFVYDIFTFL